MHVCIHIHIHILPLVNVLSLLKAQGQLCSSGIIAKPRVDLSCSLILLHCQVNAQIRTVLELEITVLQTIHSCTSQSPAGIVI